MGEQAVLEGRGTEGRTQASRSRGARPLGEAPSLLRRVASNFAVLCAAEILCRGASVLATLALAKRLGTAGYGRVEFAFNVVFWLVLIVRDCFETIVTREVARHPRITRELVNRVLAVKIALALVLFTGLCAVGALTLSERTDAQLLALYGLLLFTTSLGIDFAFRGTERMGLVALSLCLRTTIYCVGVFLFVRGSTDVLYVPVWLACGEWIGIGLVWVVYARLYGLPRPCFGMRFFRVIVRRGRSVALIQLSQAVLVTADLMVVGLLTEWGDVGRYGAPHRMVAAVMAFGLIFQQVMFPALSRSWRRSSETGRRLLDVAVRVLMIGYVPVAVGGTLLAEPLVRFLLPSDYYDSARLLAIGVWRAPLLSLAFLYQSALIAMNRESAGLRLLVGGALVSVPCIGLSYGWCGLTGASCAVLLLGLALVTAGYVYLAREGRAPAASHHLWRPLVSSLAMAPVCLSLKDDHVIAAVAAGGVVYLATLAALGGFKGLVRIELVRPERGW